MQPDLLARDLPRVGDTYAALQLLGHDPAPPLLWAACVRCCAHVLAIERSDFGGAHKGLTRPETRLLSLVRAEWPLVHAAVDRIQDAVGPTKDRFVCHTGIVQFLVRPLPEGRAHITLWERP